MSEVSAAPSRRMQLDAIGVATVLLCCVLWALQQVAAKAVMTSLPPLFQGALRSSGAALCLWAWSRWRGTPLFQRDRTLWPGLAAGTLFALEFACIYLALPRTSASRVIVFLYMAPFVVALTLPHFVRAERLDRWQMLGLIGAFAALAYAFEEGFHVQGSNQLLGDALGVAGAVLWGMTTLVIRTTTLASASAEKTLFYQLAVSAVLLFIFSAALGEAWPVRSVPAFGWMSLLFQTVVVAFASYLAWFWLLRNYSAMRISAFTFLTPLFGLLFGGWLLHEAIGARLVVALLFVALGISLVNRQRRRRV